VEGGDHCRMGQHRTVQGRTPQRKTGQRWTAKQLSATTHASMPYTSAGLIASQDVSMYPCVHVSVADHHLESDRMCLIKACVALTVGV
jgi:hypothetical protein